MRRIRRVCVIGAGLSGLACAVAAADAGRQVDVYDAAAAPLDGAAHLDLGPATIRELATLGLGEAAVRAGFAYQGVDVINARGELLCQRSTPHLAGPQLPGAIGIREESLLAAIETVAVERGARVHRGVRVETQRRAGRDGPRFSEAEIDAADIVVLAAGLESAPRRTLFPDATPVETFDAHWWQALLPRPLTVHRATWVLGHDGGKFVLLPVGVSQAGVGMARQASALAGCVNGTTRGASMRLAMRFAGTVLPSLESWLGDAADVSVRPIRAALLPQPWHHGRVVCVGDCAHALPPHFGQSTVQSLIDAVVLGELLRENAGRDVLPAVFSARRAAQAARVHTLVGQAVRWTNQPDAATDLPALAAELDAVAASPGEQPI